MCLPASGTVLIAVDNDSAGRHARRRRSPARGLRAEGRRVLLLRPRQRGADWNDRLITYVTTGQTPHGIF